MEDICSHLVPRRGEMLEFIERLVNIDSGSYCKQGIDACGRIVARELEALGFETSIIPEAECGNHVQAKLPGQGGRSLFLSAHLDTVFPEGTAARSPFRIEGGVAYGPGVGDMKGGIVLMLYALKVLRDLSLSTPPISIFLTGDEEIGSIRGRPHIEDIGRRSSWVLVMEPSSRPGSVGIRRWGLGSFQLTIHGRAAHVLEPDARGVNASRELALKVLALEFLSDPVRGVKVSVNSDQASDIRDRSRSGNMAPCSIRLRWSS